MGGSIAGDSPQGIPVHREVLNDDDAKFVADNLVSVTADLCEVGVNLVYVPDTKTIHLCSLDDELDPLEIPELQSIAAHILDPAYRVRQEDEKDEKRMPPDPVVFIHSFPSGQVLEVRKGTTFDAGDVEAILCRTDAMLQHNDFSQVELAGKAGEDYTKEVSKYLYSYGPLQEYQCAAIAAENVGGKVRRILHVVLPQSISPAMCGEELEDHLMKAVRTGLERASKLALKSVVLPLFDLAWEFRERLDDVVEFLVKFLVKALVDFAPSIEFIRVSEVDPNKLEYLKFYFEMYVPVDDQLALEQKLPPVVAESISQKDLQVNIPKPRKNRSRSPNTPKTQKKIKKVVVVLDTNVLLNCLVLVRNLRQNLRWSEVEILIPYITLSEVDGLKKADEATAKKARNAGLWLNWCAHHPEESGVVFERRKDVSGSENCNDDRILAAAERKLTESCDLYQDECLVFLVTLDRNLQTKALIHRVPVIGKAEMLQHPKPSVWIGLHKKFVK